MNDEKVPITESLGMFNTLSVEIRSKIDGLVKQVLFLSGGVQQSLLEHSSAASRLIFLPRQVNYSGSVGFRYPLASFSVWSSC